MNLQALLLFTTALASVLAAGGASAQTIYFADNFEDASDSTTFIGNSSIGGDPNGDADPDGAQVGGWAVIAEERPWKIQVTQAATGPGPATPGPGPRTGQNVLGLERFGAGLDIRAQLATAATGSVSAEFDLWVRNGLDSLGDPIISGKAQFFLRGDSDGLYTSLAAFINFNRDGTVELNGGAATAPFYTVNPANSPNTIYNHVKFDVDVAAQSFSLFVDGATLPALTNVAFTESIPHLVQLGFVEPTGDGVFYIDNVIVQGPASSVADADFDDDLDVDGADFLIWQRGVGTSTPAPGDGDANDDDSVDGLDLDIWKMNFGVPQAQVAASAIPEPSSVVLLGLAGLATAVVYHKGPMRSRMHR